MEEDKVYNVEEVLKNFDGSEESLIDLFAALKERDEEEEFDNSEATSELEDELIGEGGFEINENWSIEFVDTSDLHELEECYLVFSVKKDGEVQSNWMVNGFHCSQEGMQLEFDSFYEVEKVRKNIWVWEEK